MKYKLIVTNCIPVSLLIIEMLLFFSCTDDGPTDTSITPGKFQEKSVTKNGITFYEYIDSLHMRWGFDSVNSAISVPADYSYRCGLEINRFAGVENYANVLLRAEPSGYIASIAPDSLLGIETKNFFLMPTGLAGQCSLNVYGANSYLVNRDDYWGHGPIHSMNAYLYDPIVYENTAIDSMVQYIVLDTAPLYDTSAIYIKEKMNEIVHQAIIDIQGVNKIVDPSMLWNGKVFSTGDDFEYVYTVPDNEDTIKKYNGEWYWVAYNYDVLLKPHISRIFNVPDIILCWRTNKPHNVGTDTIILATSNGAIEIDFGTNAKYWFGNKDSSGSSELVSVATYQDSLLFLTDTLQLYHPPGDLLYETHTSGYGFSTCNLNLCFVAGHLVTPAKYIEPLFFHEMNHEFMHCLKNGELIDLFLEENTDNLMYWNSLWKEDPSDPAWYLTGNKLRYETKGGEEKQWDKAHSR